MPYTPSPIHKIRARASFHPASTPLASSFVDDFVALSGCGVGAAHRERDRADAAVNVAMTINPATFSMCTIGFMHSRMLTDLALLVEV